MFIKASGRGRAKHKVGFAVYLHNLQVYWQVSEKKERKDVFVFLRERCFNQVQNSLFCHNFDRIEGHEKLSSSCDSLGNLAKDIFFRPTG